MRDNNNSFIKLYGVGEIRADYAALVLKRMSAAYHGFLVLYYLGQLSEEKIIKAFKTLEYDIDYEVWTNKDLLMPFDKFSLELKGVVLQSPGFWEFLGKINPLEVLRTYLNDRHERNKDKLYRNELEKERLDLKNKLLKTELIRNLIEVAHSAGVPEEEITKLIRDNALVPLLKLESLQDSNIISYAELVDTADEKDDELTTT